MYYIKSDSSNIIKFISFFKDLLIQLIMMNFDSNVLILNCLESILIHGLIYQIAGFIKSYLYKM